MEYIVGIAFVAFVVGGVLWNHRTKAAAFAGVGFEVPLPPGDVAAVISALYCQGATAAMRNTFAGISVRRQESGDFVFETRLGDTGTIRIAAADEGSSVVEAETTSLYLGGKLVSEDGSPIWQLSKTLTHVIYRVLGLAPNAARMKRFQNGLVRRVTQRVQRQLQG